MDQMELDILMLWFSNTINSILYNCTMYDSLWQTRLNKKTGILPSLNPWGMKMNEYKSSRQVEPGQSLGQSKKSKQTKDIKDEQS